MKDTGWKDILVLRAAADAWYQQCLQEVWKREPDFLMIRAALTPEQRAALDSYVAACEELEHALVSLAYQLGKER